MDNIVIVKNELVVLPYITNISEIEFSLGDRFEFEVRGMFFDRTIVSEKLNTPNMWKPLLSSKILYTEKELNLYFTELLKLTDDGSNKNTEKVFSDEEMVFITNEYLGLKKLREKLLLEWDKVLNNIKKL